MNAEEVRICGEAGEGVVLGDGRAFGEGRTKLARPGWYEPLHTVSPSILLKSSVYSEEARKRRENGRSHGKYQIGAIFPVVLL